MRPFPGRRKVAGHLDDLGVGFIEGGWPGAIPKDTEFFRRAASELSLRTAQLAAFGATRKAGVAAADDPQVRALVDSLAPVVTLVAKSDIRHVERALRTSGAENLCDAAAFTGYTLDGGYAEFALADQRYCFSLPDEYSDAEAAPLLCAGLIGYRSLVAAGDARCLGIYGFGAAAHIIAQVACWQERQVFAFTRRVPGNRLFRWLR